jgi:ABC-type sulfate/molybdate transport systems ATPase subunit
MSTITNIHKKFGDFVLDIPLMDICDEGVTAVLGPSGSGKSSLFRVLMGLEDCPGASWKFANDMDLLKLPVRERRLGVVLQSFELFPHLSVIENIDFARAARGLKGSAKETNLDLLRQLGLIEILQRSAAVLSGGEQQRVALARALVAEPRMLLLDEPFSALDESNRSAARDLVKQVLFKTKISTLLITHDERDVTALAAQVHRLKAGRLQY